MTTTKTKPSTLPKGISRLGDRKPSAELLELREQILSNLRDEDIQHSTEVVFDERAEAPAIMVRIHDGVTYVINSQCPIDTGRRKRKPHRKT